MGLQNACPSDTHETLRYDDGCTCIVAGPLYCTEDSLQHTDIGRLFGVHCFRYANNYVAKFSVWSSFPCILDSGTHDLKQHLVFAVKASFIWPFRLSYIVSFNWTVASLIDSFVACVPLPCCVFLRLRVAMDVSYRLAVVNLWYVNGGSCFIHGSV